jgi:hypothetical protein
MAERAFATGDTGTVEPILGTIEEPEAGHYEGESQAMSAYQPTSTCNSVGTVVPANMALETSKALRRVVREHGDVDSFVMKKLNYATKAELCDAFSGEQVDALALAIVQIERKKAVVIGDQTGVGKGRIAAGVIRYAIMRGIVPIFMTLRDGLFSDLHRDMIKIGSGHIRPFLVNSGVKIIKEGAEGEGSDVIFPAIPANEHAAVLQSWELPEAYGYVAATYSQFQNPKESIDKRNFTARMAAGSILVLDESHAAGGKESNTGLFAQALLKEAAGATYLSATFAKAPDNMPLYAIKTDMSEANMTSTQLVEAIERGGPALQEILSATLVESGQMVRRERPYDNIDIAFTTLDQYYEQHARIVDRVTDIIQQIIRFQEYYVKPIISGMNSSAKMQKKAGVNNQPFVSKIFNVVDQLLFSLKAENVAMEAIKWLDQGVKPVIAFKSTMGAFFSDMNLTTGDTLEQTDFSMSFIKSLEGVMRYSYKGGDGKSVRKQIAITDLTPEGQAEYKRLRREINQASFGLSISPIDIIIDRLARAGYSTAEVTGRTLALNFDDGHPGGPATVKRISNDATRAYNAFNAGTADVLMINQSGATGKSAHASPDYKDQRQRVMLLHQIELDPNIEVQKWGRINRTGQLLPPIYRYITTALPSEKRLLMMMQNKLRSLFANTSSDQKGGISTATDEFDFLNKYGDHVVRTFIDDNPDFYDMLNLTDTQATAYEKGLLPDLAATVTGRVAIMPTEKQEEFYNDISQRYANYVQFLKDNDKYDLETQFLDLRAKTLSSQIVVVGKGGNSGFGDNSYLEKCSVRVLRKPYSQEELVNQLEISLAGRTPEEIRRTSLEAFNKFYDERSAKVLAKAEIPKENETEEERLERLAKLSELRAALAGFHFNTTTVLDTFQVGRVCYIPVENSQDKSLGVFLGFQTNPTASNPYAPSALLMRFAIADGRRYLRIPYSQHDTISNIEKASKEVTAEQKRETVAKWDSITKEAGASGGARGTAFIVTGNILQGLSVGKFRGKLITYSDEKGERKKGVLMPEMFKQKDAEDAEIRIPINRCFPLLKRLSRGASRFTTSNEMEFENLSFSYRIQVSKAVNEGGRFYKDEELRAFIQNGEWEQSETKYMKCYVKLDNMQPFLDLLQEKFSLTMTAGAKDMPTPEEEAAAAAEAEEEAARSGGKPQPQPTLHRYEFIYEDGGKYPTLGYRATAEGGAHNLGVLSYSRELSEREKKQFGLRPVFTSVDEPFGKWKSGLTDNERTNFEALVRHAATGNTRQEKLQALAHFILMSTDVMGDLQVVYGSYGLSDLAERLALDFPGILEAETVSELDLLLRQLNIELEPDL